MTAPKGKALANILVFFLEMNTSALTVYHLLRQGLKKIFLFVLLDLP